jgi:hypothetical protein
MSKKIIALAVPIMLFLGHQTHAAVVKNCDKDGLACERSTFDFGLTALYFKAYSDFFPSNSIGNSNNQGTFGLDTNNESGKGPWDWGGVIDGRYHFSDKNDINLSWMYYSVDYRGTDLYSNVFTYTEFSYRGNSINVISGRIKLNSVNAEFAQSFELSPRSWARLFAGGQYLNIKTKSSLASFSASTGGFGSYRYGSNTFTENKYEGIGPRIGLDANYKLKENVSIFANSAATILLARRTQSESGDSYSFTGTSVSSNVRTDRSNKSIPELEAKLGLTYNQPLMNGSAALSAGWSVINYFNLLEGSDLTLSGPFVQGKWVG